MRIRDGGYAHQTNKISKKTYVVSIEELRLDEDSVADPWYLGVDPNADLDPRIHASE